MPEYPLPQFEDVLFAAVLQRFFEPVVIGIEMQMTPSYNNQPPISIPVPKYGVAPIAQVADQMYRTNADKLSALIWEKIDRAELADRIAKECVEKQFSTPNASGYGTRETQEMIEIRKDVRERVAAELTRRQLAKIDAEDREAQLAKKAAEDAAQQPVEAPDYDPLGDRS